MDIATVQAVSSRLLTSKAGVQSHTNIFGIYDGQIYIEVGFPLVFLFPLPIISTRIIFSRLSSGTGTVGYLRPHYQGPHFKPIFKVRNTSNTL
jgi:hypothetical protein